MKSVEKFGNDVDNSIFVSVHGIYKTLQDPAPVSDYDSEFLIGADVRHGVKKSIYG